jgi:hypothetical protein
MFSWILGLASLICYVIIVIHAFKNSILKGVLCILICCWVYTLYYALVEFDHEKKWLIVIGWLLPTILSVAASMMGL